MKHCGIERNGQRRRFRGLAEFRVADGVRQHDGDTPRHLWNSHPFNVNVRERMCPLPTAHGMAMRLTECSQRPLPARLCHSSATSPDSRCICRPSPRDRLIQPSTLRPSRSSRSINSSIASKIEASASSLATVSLIDCSLNLLSMQALHATSMSPPIRYPAHHDAWAAQSCSMPHTAPHRQQWAGAKRSAAEMNLI